MRFGGGSLLERRIRTDKQKEQGLRTLIAPEKFIVQDQMTGK